MNQPRLQYQISENHSSDINVFLEEYWQNDLGTFNTHVKDLKGRFELDSLEIAALVSLSKAYVDFGICKCCGEGNFTYVENRSRAIQVFKNFYYYFFCHFCREKAKVFCKGLNFYQSKNIWMRLSIKYELWKELDNDEINFLKSIYYLKDWNRIYCELLMLNLDYGFKTLDKLDKMNLILYYDEDNIGLKKVILLESLQQLIQSKNI